MYMSLDAKKASIKYRILRLNPHKMMHTDLWSLIQIIKHT